MSKTVEEYTILAEQGDSEAMYQLGGYYAFWGPVSERDYVKAKGWYEQAIEYGHTYAMNDMGELYTYGYGVERNLEKALELHKRAVEHGYVGGLIDVGNIYMQMGSACEAIECYKKAAHAGDVEALYTLGILYEYGSIQIKKDYNEAIVWYEQAAQKQHIQSMKKMYLACKNRAYGMCNKQKAMYWQEKIQAYYRENFERGNTRAVFEIGNLYTTVLETEQDYREALSYYSNVLELFYEKSPQICENILVVLGKLYTDAPKQAHEGEKSPFYYEALKVYKEKEKKYTGQ